MEHQQKSNYEPTLRVKFADNISENQNFENVFDYINSAIFRINAPGFYLLVLLYSIALISGLISLVLSAFSLNSNNSEQSMFISMIYIFVGIGLAIFAYGYQNHIGLHNKAMSTEDLFESKPAYYDLFRKIKWLKRFRALPDQIQNLKAKRLFKRYSGKIEESFNEMRNERNPRAYFKTGNDSCKVVSPNFYYGKFRILMLSNKLLIRFMILKQPFSHGFQELFIRNAHINNNTNSNALNQQDALSITEANHSLSQAESLFQEVRILNEQSKIQLSEAKNIVEESRNLLKKNPGAKVKIDYLEITMRLICSPFLNTITGKHGDITKLNSFITELNNNQEKRLKIPERSQLSEFSKKIIKAIKKNRKLPS